VVEREEWLQNFAISPAQTAMPKSGVGRALVWIIPLMSCRNQAGDPLAAGPEDAASLVCEKAMVAVIRNPNAPAVQTRKRLFIFSSLDKGEWNRRGRYVRPATS